MLWVVLHFVPNKPREHLTEKIGISFRNFSHILVIITWSFPCHANDAKKPTGTQRKVQLLPDPGEAHVLWLAWISIFSSYVFKRFGAAARIFWILQSLPLRFADIYLIVQFFGCLDTGYAKGGVNCGSNANQLLLLRKRLKRLPPVSLHAYRSSP